MAEDVPAPNDDKILRIVPIEDGSGKKGDSSESPLKQILVWDLATKCFMQNWI